MRNSEIILILTVLCIFISSSAQATLADCLACRGAQPDWTESATAFLEGKLLAAYLAYVPRLGI